VSSQDEVLWVVTLCIIEVGYQHFRELKAFLGYQSCQMPVWNWCFEDWEDFIKFSRCEPCCFGHYTVSQPRRPWLESSLLWKPQISH